MIRRVLATVVGHVDHGKTSLLDRIRGSSVTEKEAGLITQAIGSSLIPVETIQRVCAKLLEATKLEVTIPGLLFIDTPGHAAFSNLRRRGGSLADIAIVVIDINEGFREQTLESIEILKKHKTPFIIAANKIDLINGWKWDNEKPLIPNINAQDPAIIEILEKKMYELVGVLHEKFALQSERFDRVSDYTSQIAIVPTSASTAEGIPELLIVLVGLAQKFLERQLEIDVESAAKGTILEVTETKGIGKTLDVIIYDGTLSVGDEIVIGGIDEPIVTKVKSLFEPAPLQEMREKRTKFRATKRVSAAMGVKISAKDIDDVIPGMPVEVVNDNLDEVKERIQEQIEEVVIETDDEGVIVKADSLGSLEALVTLLRGAGIAIRKTGIGDITKKDIVDAESNLEKNPLTAVVLGFNVKTDLTPGKVRVLTNDVIYRLLADYDNWLKEEKIKMESSRLDSLTRPFKIELLRGYVFRQSNPAVCGVHVLEGTVKTNVQLMKSEGKTLTSVKSIQAEQETIDKAEKGKQVAVSMPGVMVGRQINEGDTLYSFIPENEFRQLKEFKELLTKEERELMKEIAKIMRKRNPVWGV